MLWIQALVPTSGLCFLCLWGGNWDLFGSFKTRTQQENILTGFGFARLLKDPNQGCAVCFTAVCYWIAHERTTVAFYRDQ